jgi:hypothetical protein
MELGVARSTAFQWTKHLPRGGDEEEVLRRKAHAKAMTDARWAPHRAARSADRAAIHAAVLAEVGTLTERELLLIGAVLPRGALTQVTLKRHNPTSVRHNAGEDYRGCLVVKVRRATDLYWRIEGMMSGLIGGR